MKKMNKWASLLLAAVLMLSTVQVSYAEEGEAQEMRNLAPSSTYSYSEAPHQEHQDNGNRLTDGKFGDLNAFWDPAWVAFLGGKTREITFDLGENKSIGRIKTHFLYEGPAAIYSPNILSYYVSEDGQNWAPVKHMASPEPIWADKSATGVDYVWDGEVDGVPDPSLDAKKAYARYVKVAITTTVWVFLDEVEIYGVDGKTQDAFDLKPVTPEYLKPGRDTADIRDLLLLYNGKYENDRGDWNKDNIIPYVSYVDEQGNPTDWMYDGVLYLGLKTDDNQRDFGSTAVLNDWKWYLDKTFKADGDMANLNEAVKEAGVKLNDSNHIVKVVLMIPYAGEKISDFGDVDGDGVSENFNAAEVGEEAAFANRTKAIKWYMDQVKQRWLQGDYDRLDLVGMYWLAEGVEHGRETVDMNLLRYSRDLVHQADKKFFWIPFFSANMNFAGKALGFDATMLQPNHYFDGTEAVRVDDAAYLAQHHGLGIEMETDERMNHDPGFRKRYIEYLNSGVDNGFMTGAFKAYYQGVGGLLESARSTDPRARELYDWMYQFVKGTYQKQPAS
ncbi:DUF4855 domain-containing protein [Paenibacillus apiarius]|uniref:DUF4855 domain-containing protein n=1 Tax=Paenibacillus apiarius TaxID=46240 RepID=UPI003B3AAAA1